MSKIVERPNFALIDNFSSLWNTKHKSMIPLVSIIMGSTSDLQVMRKAAEFLNELQIPFEINALSAHRTPEEVEKFAHHAESRGLKVIIAAAGMAAHLPGVIASMAKIPVIGVPIKASLDGLDALLAIVQMPPGIPVATVGIDGALNAGILAAQILALSDTELAQRMGVYKEGLKKKIVQANNELTDIRFEYKTN
jgi:5-(carboxyamino)imidazole ribonucleotide mutase